MEHELWFYADVKNPQGFDQAVSQEIHEQWEFVVPAQDGSKKKARVRATTKDGVTVYTETLKVYTKGEGNNILSCEEPTVEITEEYFKTWIKVFGTTGCNKIRYVFLSKQVSLNVEGREPVILPEVQYEVDVLLNASGQRSRWCKVDIEIDKILTYLNEYHPDIKKFDAKVALSSLPIGLENAFSGDTDDEEQKEGVKRFWEKFAITPSQD